MDFEFCLDGIVSCKTYRTKSDVERSSLKPGGRIIILEFDTDIPNRCMSWPVSCKNLQKLLTNSGFSRLQKLAGQPSFYQTAGMYSALIIFEK